MTYYMRINMGFEKKSTTELTLNQIVDELRPQGGLTLFFTKINFGFYMKAKSTNYKPVFIESKNLI